VSGCGLAIDTLGLPTDTLELGKAKANKKKGIAFLSAELEWPGLLQASGTGMKAVTRQASGPGTVELPIRPKGKVKKKLAKKGKAAVKVKVSHLPEGGSIQTETRKVGLRKKR
jgi:hypothetical protein